MEYDCRERLRSSCSVQNVKQKVPVTNWLPKYSLKKFQGDIIAGLTVGLTVIPQGLAYAQIAELPPQYGLNSAFMGCFVYCLLGTSKDITLGPTAIMSLMTAAFAVAPAPLHQDPTIAILLSLICGVIQLVMGILCLGFLVEFISHPVISGFTTAAAITIAFGQIKTLGLLTWIRMYGRTLYIKARNAFVVLIASGLAAGLKIRNDLEPFSLTGNITEGLPPFKPPAFSLHIHGNTTWYFGDILKHVGSGVAIVPILGLVETIAIGKAFARKNCYSIDASQELIAIGIANIMGAFVSAYPVTGSFSRTAVNSQSGVATPLGGIFTGALVLLALALLTPLFYFIPKSALAGVIIMAVLDMVDFRIVRHMWRVKKIDVVPWLVTFLCSFLLGIEYGILIGIGVSLLMLLYPWARPSVKVHNREIAVIELNQGLRFPGVDFVKDKVYEQAVDVDGVHRSVIIDCSHLSAIDFSTVECFASLLEDFKEKGILLVLTNLQPSVMGVFQRAELSHLRYANSVEAAISLIYDETRISESYQMSYLVARSSVSDIPLQVLNQSKETDPEPDPRQALLSGTNRAADCSVQAEETEERRKAEGDVTPHDDNITVTV